MICIFCETNKSMSHRYMVKATLFVNRYYDAKHNMLYK